MAITEIEHVEQLTQRTNLPRVPSLVEESPNEQEYPIKTMNYMKRILP
ncbi:hypothetical protein [Bradyrhizobium sp. DOA9]|nr:hypothetical protein [Bradyrhizobium sp. DOA9]